MEITLSKPDLRPLLGSEAFMIAIFARLLDALTP
jgi:hypothetical protein